MAGSRLDRFRARLGSSIVFPIRMLLGARSASTLVPTTNPFFLPAFAVATRWLHGRSVVPLVYDLYPDALEAVGVSQRGGLVDKVASSVNRWWLRRADGVVFIGEGMAAHVCRRYATPRRWTILETGAEVDEFERTKAPRDIELAHWCEGKRIIGYVGNLGHVHDWKTLGDAIPRVIDAHEDVGIIVAASGINVGLLKQRWSGLPASVVRFVSPLDDQAWAWLLSRSEISISTLRQSAGETSIPSKTFSAMAAGSAIVAVAPTGSDLARLISRHQCGVVVEPEDVDGLVAAFAKLLDSPEDLVRYRASALKAARELYDMPKLAQRWGSFLSEVNTSNEAPRGAKAKRAIDLILASGALLATLPILVPAMLAVRATLGGTVLFRQQRPGLHGRPFELIKLRTMRHAAPGSDALATDAVRLTRLGRMLRAASIDELPTLWNVIRGDMSLVGPRPLLMRYLTRYSAEQRRRHDVKPGITGWAQINGRNAIGWTEKFALDLWYVDHASILVDIEILLRTVGGVVRREGINHGSNATMPEFMGSDVPTPSTMSS